MRVELNKRLVAVVMTALIGCGGAAHAQDTEASAKKPNILLIVSDDTGRDCPQAIRLAIRL